MVGWWSNIRQDWNLFVKTLKFILFIFKRLILSQLQIQTRNNFWTHSCHWKSNIRSWILFSKRLQRFLLISQNLCQITFWNHRTAVTCATFSALFRTCNILVTKLFLNWFLWIMFQSSQRITQFSIVKSTQ